MLIAATTLCPADKKDSSLFPNMSPVNEEEFFLLIQNAIFSQVMFTGQKSKAQLCCP